eukprot:5284691-Pleurochrysis_carterae.AAC.1
MSCAAARANKALPPSPASLVVARRLQSTWLSRPHSHSIFVYVDDIHFPTSLRRSMLVCPPKSARAQLTQRLSGWNHRSILRFDLFL